MGSGPVFILLTSPADQKHTRDPCGCHVTRGGGVESAVLSLPGRWMVPGKQRKREGDRMSLLIKRPSGKPPGAGSSSHQQPLAQSQAQKGGQLVCPWGSS